MKQLRQALDKLKAEASLGEAKQFLASAKTVRGLHVITTTRTGMDVAAMRTMGDFLRDKDPSVVAVIASINGEKVSFLAVCGKEAVARGIKAAEGGRRPGSRGRFCFRKNLLNPGERS